MYDCNYIFTTKCYSILFLAFFKLQFFEAYVLETHLKQLFFTFDMYKMSK